MDFEAYLTSKKIDSAEFLKAEPAVWKTWKIEFDQMHPASFTAQKLYLINPIRRKYLLKEVPSQNTTPLGTEPSQQGDSTATEPPVVKPASSPKPAVPRPVFKPKPKTS